MSVSLLTHLYLTVLVHSLAIEAFCDNNLFTDSPTESRVVSVHNNDYPVSGSVFERVHQTPSVSNENKTSSSRYRPETIRTYCVHLPLYSLTQYPTAYPHSPQKPDTPAVSTIPVALPP